MTNELEPLKECPFCGGEAKEGQVKINGAESNDIGWIGCQECRVFMNYTHGERGKREAIKAWNTRYKRTCKNLDVVPKDGSGFYPTPHFKCSECGASYALTDYAYWCPSCGAEVIND